MPAEIAHPGTKASPLPHASSEGEQGSGQLPGAGVLILNADDWGRDRETTDRTLECVLRRTVSSVSAMVFMEDSERAATLALQQKIDVGLHLNFTTLFSASQCPARIARRQQDLAGYLLRHRLAEVMFHPLLAPSFEYVVAAQLEEFSRLYGTAPRRLDGHHHMHLCANVLFGGLLPRGTIVRRSFSFQSGEKSWGNRAYRRVLNLKLAQRHTLTDFFFSLPPLEIPGRLRRIFSLAQQAVVEVETHPINPEEYRFLAGEQIFIDTAGSPIASGFTLRSSAAA